MNLPMTTLLYGVLLIIGGLVIVFLSPKGRSLAVVFYWFGIAVAICGLILALIRPLVWVGRNLNEALGA